MSEKKKKNYHVLIAVSVVFIAIVSIGLLVMNIYTLRYMTYLDRFLAAGNENYRNIKAQSARPQRASGTAAGGGAGDRTCVSVDLDLNSDPALGDPNAPVVMVEYSDFECPFCARYFSDTYGQIQSQYIDTGLVRLYYKDFPLDNIHPLARPAAVAANCIYNRHGADAFFTFHDRLFELGGRLGSVDLVNQIALESNISADELAACAADAAYQDEIEADIQEAQAVGVTGTPTFVINGELVVGAVPFATFETVIENALSGNGCQG